MTEEARLQRMEDQIADVLEQLEGGQRVSWERSVRGRLHFLANQEAARMLREEQATRNTAQRWTRGEKLLGGLVAVLALGLQLAALLVAVAHG